MIFSTCDDTCASLQLTSSVLLAQVREAPYIPQAHGEAHLSQDVLQLAVPSGASIVFWHLYLWDLFPGDPSDVQGAVLVVERLLMCEQIGHRLCDVLLALLALRHLAVLRHRGGRGSGGGRGGGSERKSVGAKKEAIQRVEKRWMDEAVRQMLSSNCWISALGLSPALERQEGQIENCVSRPNRKLCFKAS